MRRWRRRWIVYRQRRKGFPIARTKTASSECECVKERECVRKQSLREEGCQGAQFIECRSPNRRLFFPFPAISLFFSLIALP